MSLKTLNKYNKEVNILHFQGRNLNQFEQTAALIFNVAELKPLEDNLSIVACWTDDNRSVLYQQLSKNNIEIINALPKDYDYSTSWDMRNKIKFYIDCLENVITTDVVLLLDAYDVLIASTNNIVKKFSEQPYKILFNSTVNNFPDVQIDHIENRAKYDKFSPFFNAGCCIGYRQDLIKFYKECYELVDIENEFNSEQYVIRYAFAKYSDDPNQKFIWIDYDRNIFHSMGYMSSQFDANTMTIKITDNLCVPKNKKDISKIW